MYQRILLTIVCILSGITTINAQNYLDYYALINKAELAYLDQSYQLSDSLFQKSFDLVNKPFKEDYFTAALNAEHLGDNNKVYQYLELGISNGLIWKRIRKSMSTFKKSTQWKPLKHQYDSLHQQYLTSLNIPLKEEITKMIQKDQHARSPILGSVKKMKKVDAYNFQRLLQIIKENNELWPGFSTIGETTPKGKYDVTKNITLLPLHFSEKQIEILQPYMLQAVLAGEMYPYQYARILDYSAIKNREAVTNANGSISFFSCMIYGTYKNMTICDCTTANKERTKIGFEPLDEFYRKIASNYTCK